MPFNKILKANLDTSGVSPSYNNVIGDDLRKSKTKVNELE
jgi:hypothetical protein